MAAFSEGDSPLGPSSHPLKIFDTARKQDRFVYACAPMLAFRQTVHKYGVDLCWTPMMLAKEFNRSSVARDTDLTISTRGLPSPHNHHHTHQPQQHQHQHQQPPTIVQFGANSPQELSRAASLAAPHVAGIDLNCGCPQSWACAETLGAALMDRRDLVRDMVVTTRQRMGADGWAVGLEADVDSPRGRSVSVKIRVHDDLRKTMEFLDTVIGYAQNRHVDWITIHPRTRHTPSTVPIRSEALEILAAKYSPVLPVLFSGDVFSLSALPLKPAAAAAAATNPLPTTSSLSLFNRGGNDDNHVKNGHRNGDVENNIPRPSNTHISGFMSARGLLANPALFAGFPACPWEAVESFMCNVARCPLPFKLVVHHVSEMCGPGMGPDKSALLPKKERAKLAGLSDMLELIDFLDDMMEQQTGKKGGLRRDL